MSASSHRLIIASRNQKKTGEIRALLAPWHIDVCSVADFPDVPETVEDGDSFADHFFETFHDFVGQQLNDKRTIGWDGLVQERAHSDREGFDLFISLVRTFASRRLPEDE